MRVFALAAATLALLAATAAAQSPAKPAVDSGAVDRAALDTTSDGTDPAVDDSAGQIVVTEVDPAGGWAKLGVRKGDVVLYIDGEPVNTRSAMFARATAVSTSRCIVYIEVLRKKKPLLLRRVVKASGPTAGGAACAPAGSPSALEADLAAEIDRMVVAKGGNTWAVDVEPLLTDPMRFGRHARVAPAVKDGKPIGFKVYAISPGSLLDRLGLKNGDTITHAGGYELSSPDQALEAYTKLRSATKIEVKLIRRGKPVTHYYLTGMP